ncbi:hypothetical protein INS49_007366 [Diaporthe citri]|uniref:uncharacterized protein n=1 Tax=Diaporthe citri TaxID=83186 RepID=UPI001C8254D7|nr:uncharacterized protein INS49_007366 [Diaporthe citri]KAG6365755.1 hypothetical protein INS49_007366 [Diaporthe citri]
MLTEILYLWAGLAPSVTANPLSGLRLTSRASTTYTARFDDLNPVNVLSELVNAPEIGSYNGLRWQGFYTIQPGLFSGFLNVGGLLPESGSNAAGYDTLGSLDTNTGSITRTITVESRRTFPPKPATMDLHSFWWGCQFGLKQYVLTAPAACNLTIIGSRAFQEKTRKTVRFQPILIDLLMNMKLVELGDQFKGLDTLTFITQYDVGLNGATSFDDFTYTINL